MADATSASPPRLAAPAVLRRPSAATGVLILLLLASATVLLYAGRHLTFFLDEWSWILRRRGSGLGTFLDPHNGHFSLFPIAVYKVLFATVGLRHYTPYRVVGVAMHLLCCVLLYILVRRRVGPWLALVPTGLLLFMGTASQDLLWPFQIGFLSSVAGGLGALALIEDGRSDVLACLLLVWSIVSSAIGIPFLIAAAVALVARRDPWSRLWTIAVPAGVFLIWYLGWGSSESQHVTTDSLLAAPAYVAEAAAGAVQGIAGLGPLWAPALAVATVVAFTLSWHRTGRDRPTPTLLAATAGALAFWILIATQRGNHPSPTAGRYLYIGAVFIWLTAAEVRLGTGLTGMWRWLAAVLVLGALIANIGVLRTDEAGLSQHDDNVRAALTAVEVATPVVSPHFVPDSSEASPLTAGPYLAAARDLGTPAFPVAELAHLPASLRRRTDTVLERAEALRASPAPSTGCRLMAPLLSRAALAVNVFPGRTFVIRDLQSSSVKIYLRRFTPAFGPPRFALVAGHSISAIHFPVDRAPGTSWHLLIVPGHGVATCLR